MWVETKSRGEECPIKAGNFTDLLGFGQTIHFGECGRTNINHFQRSQDDEIIPFTQISRSKS